MKVNQFGACRIAATEARNRKKRSAFRQIAGRTAVRPYKIAAQMTGTKEEAPTLCLADAWNHHSLSPTLRLPSWPLLLPR